MCIPYTPTKCLCFVISLYHVEYLLFVACLTMQSVLFLNHCFFHKWYTLHECSTSKQLSKCLSTTEKRSKNVEKKKRLCTLHTMDNCFDTQWLERMIHVHNYSTTFLRESIQMDSKMRREKMQAYLYRKHNNKQRYRCSNSVLHSWLNTIIGEWLDCTSVDIFFCCPAAFGSKMQTS